jgi:uncharacterized protein YdeI (YjbR/CyaY-like superfamily)
MQEKEKETFCPRSQQDWRQWLQENHRTKQSVWVIFYKKKANVPTLSWSEAVDEALCFGWIDSVKKTLDEGSFIQFFSRRKPNGTWSKINKVKITQLIAEGKMAEAGLESIERAKQNGSWIILDEVEELIIPDDLERALSTQPDAKAFFLSLSKSVRKLMLYRLVVAKQAETRQKRINEIVETASQNKKPKQF